MRLDATHRLGMSDSGSRSWRMRVSRCSLTISGRAWEFDPGVVIPLADHCGSLCAWFTPSLRADRYAADVFLGRVAEPAYWRLFLRFIRWEKFCSRRTWCSTRF